MTASGAASALVAGATCARHAQRAATGLCARCGDYLCGLCGRRVEARLYCPACADRVSSEHGRRAAQAFAIGLASVHFLFFLGPVAIALGLMELAEIRAGQSPIGGRAFARAGVALGIAALLMAASAAAMFMFWRAG